MYQLISATPSPYARKVRIQLIEKQIPFELLTEVPWNKDTTVSQHNPLGKVPVLLTPEGESVFESRYIGEWIEIRHPEPALMPADGQSRLAVKRFEVLADGACDALVLMFFEKSREAGKRSKPWFARQERKLEAVLRELATRIGDKPFCHGDQLTMADIAVGSLLGYLALRWPDHPWQQEHPNLARFSEAMEARESFQQTRPVAQNIRDQVV